MAGCLLAANRVITSSPDSNRPQSSLKRKKTADNTALFLLANKQAQQQSKLDSKCNFFFKIHSKIYLLNDFKKFILESKI